MHLTRTHAKDLACLGGNACKHLGGILHLANLNTSARLEGAYLSKKV
jgi:hypothetical protein